MIIFLHGEDDFRIKRKLSELKEKFRKDVDPSGEAIIFFDGTKLVLDKLNTAVNSGSLFQGVGPLSGLSGSRFTSVVLAL